MKLLIVDTDVVSYIFKWHPLAARYLDLLRGNNAFISFMTLAEMRFGALEAHWGLRKRNLLERFLSEFPVYYPDEGLCTLWAEVRHESNRKGKSISSQDAWIAATALHLGAPLVTNDARDYEHLKNLEIYTR
jgi:tRNA(fMet)-specific endonuclease VapC